ncbi:MAG: SGNH/GDSL hydrolase family protein [Planctomycetes bacterium]|nr:SGNH/GDSL hydrolase family protein [Planctomycetota bacterium]
MASADGSALVPGPDPPHAGAHFRIERLPLAKEPGVTRVVCLGDSTVHGHPFDPPAPFADWLAARLPLLLPGRRFEVVNLGVNGMDSEAVADLAEELAPLAPDLAIVYVGHNEFLDQHLGKSVRPSSHALQRALRHSWFLRWLAQHGGGGGATGGAGDGGDRDRELVAQLRQRGALDATPLLAPEWIERTHARYHASLQRTARALRDAGARTLFCRPLCDLADTPPQRSTLPADCSEAERAALAEQLRSAPEALVAALPDRAAWRARWSTVAAVRYALGRAALLRGDTDEARRELEAARDLDGHPVRATAALLAELDRLVAEEPLLLVDPWPALFAAAGPRGVAGQDGWFVDYVHPDLRGHELLADVLLHALADAGWLAPRPEWSFTDEPPRDETARRMGLTLAAQATSLARRGLFALGQAYLDPESELAKGAADSFERALRLDPDCAQGYAGRGALALLRGDGATALAAFREAERRDARALDSFVEGHASNATIRELFARAGVTVRDGRLVPVEGGPPPPSSQR